VKVASLFGWLLNVKVESSEGDAVEEIGGISLKPGDILDVGDDGIVRVGVMEAVKADTVSCGIEKEEGIGTDKGSV
jgi:hypothetical protein